MESMNKPLSMILIIVIIILTANIGLTLHKLGGGTQSPAPDTESVGYDEDDVSTDTQSSINPQNRYTAQSIQMENSDADPVTEQIRVLRDLTGSELFGKLKYRPYVPVAYQLQHGLLNMTLVREDKAKAEYILKVTNIMKKELGLRFIADISDMFDGGLWSVKHSAIDTTETPETNELRWLFICCSYNQFNKLKIIEFTFNKDEITDYYVY